MSIAKRIIACLDIKDGRTVKGVEFVALRDAGDPVELGRAYSRNGIDELVFLDITATVERRRTLVELVRRIAQELWIPFTVGGGIQTPQDVEELLLAGADKISINSAAVRNPNLVEEIAKRFGSQCLVVAIDARKSGQDSRVCVDGGRTMTPLHTVAWAKEVADRGAGEILLTSMDHDGTKNGFAIELTATVSNTVSIPVIASGGGGAISHFAEVLTNGFADAALAASVFHFAEIDPLRLKHDLAASGITVRL